MHIVSSTFNQLAPSYHPAAKIYLDTITAQKKSCTSEDRALKKEQKRTTQTAVNNSRRPFLCQITAAELKERVYKRGSLASPSSCPFCHAHYLGSWENICGPLQISLLLTFQETDLVLFHFSHTRARLQRGFYSHNSMRVALNLLSSS